MKTTRKCNLKMEIRNMNKIDNDEKGKRQNKGNG